MSGRASWRQATSCASGSTTFPSASTSSAPIPEGGRRTRGPDRTAASARQQGAAHDRLRRARPGAQQCGGAGRAAARWVTHGQGARRGDRGPSQLQGALRGREHRAAHPTICELWLWPLEAALEYLPDEYVLLEDRDHQLPPRSYSIANAPCADGLISLLVIRVPDGETSAWGQGRLRAGEQVSVSGPTARSWMTQPRRRRPCSWQLALGWPRSGRCPRQPFRPAHAHR